MVTVTWDNWCDPAVKGKPRTPPSALRITLPGGRGSLDADYNAVPECVDPTAPSTIGVSAFQARPDPARTGVVGCVPRRLGARSAAPRAPRPRPPLPASCSRTPRTQRPASGAARLHPAARPERDGRGLRAQLPCRARDPAGQEPRVRDAGPRARRTRRSEKAGLFWELDPFGARAPRLHARVTIAK